MKTNIKKPKLKLVGEDGNAFSIISRTRTALRRAGYEEDHVNKYVQEATSGDYDNVLIVTMRYVDVS